MATNQPSPPKEFIDTIGTFQDGVNGYTAPLLLPKTALASGLNTTVRGDYVSQRSVLRKIALDASSQSLLNSAISSGMHQAAVYFNPDSGPEGIANVIGGRLISIFPDPNAYTAKAIEITTWKAAAWVNGNNYLAGEFASYVVGGVARDFQALNALAPSTIPPPNDQGNWKPLNGPNGQNWLWQSEMFVIWNDGVSNPVFYDINTGTAVRSQFGVSVSENTQVTNAAGFQVLAPGTPTTGVTVTSNVNMTIGDTLYFLNFGNAVVLEVNGDGVTITINNINIRTGLIIPNGGGVYWTKLGNNNNKQLPPGRMGAYGMGRNWVSAVDGRQFFASDIAGGSSGTQADDFRDAPLNITENAFLAGGGNFLIPGSTGPIQAFRFAATLDASLGQGPLQVLNAATAFSCQTPVNRLDWQNVNSPILTESIITYGATGQDSTISVNSDLMFRSLDGIRSLILARRDFDTWGNVPISAEVSNLLMADNQTLLNWGSAIVFDNRVLFTATPIQISQGVVHKALVPINMDPLSSLRGKQPSVFDAIQWTGLNAFKLITGSFANRQRAFAICWNANTSDVELYEILPDSNTSYLDNDITRIVWAFNTASLFRESSRTFKRLVDGEINVDNLLGEVTFQAWYKPDQYPCFQPWLQWDECQKQPRNALSPGFRPRMGMGAPTNVGCDETNDRRLDCGYTFDFRFVITGCCQFLGARFKAIEQPEPRFAPPSCSGICPS